MVPPCRSLSLVDIGALVGRMAQRGGVGTVYDLFVRLTFFTIFLVITLMPFSSVSTVSRP